MKQKNFLQIIVVALGLFGFSSAITAQTDVTAAHLTNTGFEANVTYSPADGTTTETPYADKNGNTGAGLTFSSAYGTIPGITQKELRI